MLLPGKLRKKLERARIRGGVSKDLKCPVKFFDQFGSWTMYAYSIKGNTLFGLVVGEVADFGPVPLNEIRAAGIVRDVIWDPDSTLGDAIEQVKQRYEGLDWEYGPEIPATQAEVAGILKRINEEPD